MAIDYTYTESDTGTGAPSASYVYAFPITISSSGTIESLGIEWADTDAGNVRVAIYSAGVGKPGALLAESSSTAMVGSATWQDITLSYSIASGSYWLAVAISASRDVHYRNVTPSRSYYLKSYGAFDSSWAASTEDNVSMWHMRATYSISSQSSKILFFM
jgi:hypothetical protein